MTKKALIVFDMDGVLIDVSTSYRETVRQTARVFLAEAKGGGGLPDPLFSLAELAAVKQSGGLNNDWDLTYRVIQLLCRRVGHSDSAIEKGDKWSIYRQTVSRWDAAPLTEFLNTVDRPLTRLLSDQTTPVNDFVAGMYQGDVGSGNVIKQIFQEIYLGESLFSETYSCAPVLHKDTGLNHTEKLIIEKNSIRELAEKNCLAIATGRPRAEAIYPLSVFGLAPFFDRVVTLDDCLAAEKKYLARDGVTRSLSKPDPFMLNMMTQMIEPLPEKRYYVGDMPDDMVAASNARDNYNGIGFTATAPDPTELKARLTAAGARHVFEDPAMLISFLMNRQ